MMNTTRMIGRKKESRALTSKSLKQANNMIIIIIKMGELMHRHRLSVSTSNPLEIVREITQKFFKRRRRFIIVLGRRGGEEENR